MSVRNVEEFLPKCAALVHYSAPLLASVRDADDRHACTGEILESLDSFIDSLLWQDAWACIEIVNFFHVIMWLINICNQYCDKGNDLI
jgi:hypothetical protein